MNPERFEIMLNDYVDDELSLDDRAEFEQYLSAHSEAQAVLDALLRLKGEAASLPRNVYPSNELWNRLSAEIESRPAQTQVPTTSPAFWRMALPLAASLLMVFGLVYYATQTQQPESLSPVAVETAAEMPESYHAAVREYELAREELALALEERLETMSPGVRQTIEDNLAVMNGAMSEIRVALENNPTSPDLLWMLVATQRKELQLMQELANLPDGA